MSNSIMCCANSSGIPFKSLYVHAKTSLNSFNNYYSSNTLHVSNYALIFTICGFALVHRLNFINCWSWVNIHPPICNSYVLIFAKVSSTMTLPGLWLSTSLALSFKVTSGSYMFPALFFFVLYISNSYFKIIVFTLVSMISTLVVFTYWIHR